MMYLHRAIVVIVIAAAFAASAAGQPKDIRRGKIVKLDVDKYAITINADGKDIDLTMTEETVVGGSKGKSLKERLSNYKVGLEVEFIARGKDGKNHLTHMRGFEGGKTAKKPPEKVDLAKLVPLPELGEKEYQGHQGGFYPGGKNTRPEAHEAAGLRLAKEVVPRNPEGKPDEKGKIVLLSVGMSNTSQASMGFQKALRGANNTNPAFLFVNGAQGGMTAARIQNPDNKDGMNYWGEIDRRLKAADITREQVQVVWIKQADAGPKSGFPAYAKTLEGELTRIVQLLPGRFPNVKQVYLSSRTFGGYATTGLNPEPYAYESAFSVKWLIERQIKGEAELNFDPKQGAVKAPWLSWGPYLWANGSTKRDDGFSYAPADFTPNDGTHLTASGQEKVGRLMLQFFQNDATTRWFAGK